MAAITIFNRAKIFQAFDALPGLREALAQKEWEHEHLQKSDIDRLCKLPNKAIIEQRRTSIFGERKNYDDFLYEIWEDELENIKDDYDEK